jgi:hypothetical protein
MIEQERGIGITIPEGQQMDWKDPRVGEWLVGLMGNGNCYGKIVRILWKANTQSVENTTIENAIWAGIINSNAVGVEVKEIRNRLPDGVRLYTILCAKRHILLPTIQTELFLLPEDEDRIVTEYEPGLHDFARWVFTRHVEGNMLKARIGPNPLQTLDLLMKHHNNVVKHQELYRNLDFPMNSDYEMDASRGRMGVIIRSLNMLLEQYKSQNLTITSIRGAGYVLRQSD